MASNDDWFPLSELATRLGALVWVEEQLAEVLGSWSSIEAHAPAAVMFAAAGGHHRWHGATTRECLPTSPQLDAETAIRPPTTGWKAAVDTMHSLVDPEATATRLKILVRVIDPWLDREIGALTALARPVSDAAMIRWFRFASIDHHDGHNAAADLLAARADDAVRFDDHLLVNEIDLTG